MVTEQSVYQLSSYPQHMVEGTDAPPPKLCDVERFIKSPCRGPLGAFSDRSPETIDEAVG